MLKLKYMFDNVELAKQALHNWEHDSDTLDEYLKYFKKMDDLGLVNHQNQEQERGFCDRFHKSLSVVYGN